MDVRHWIVSPGQWQITKIRLDRFTAQGLQMRTWDFNYPTKCPLDRAVSPGLFRCMTHMGDWSFVIRSQWMIVKKMSIESVRCANKYGSNAQITNLDIANNEPQPLKLSSYSLYT